MSTICLIKMTNFNLGGLPANHQIAKIYTPSIIQRIRYAYCGSMVLILAASNFLFHIKLTIIFHAL